MRHLRRTVKLGRTSKHKEAMLANMACSLIQHEQIQTTLAKAKALKPFADKLVTLGKRGTLHSRRLAVARIHQEKAVRKLFGDIAPRFKVRAGGYTRIFKLGPRASDAAPMALIEWVEKKKKQTASASAAAEGAAKKQKEEASAAKTEASATAAAAA